MSTYLPLYPEQRHCAQPTTDQILRLFGLAARNKLVHNGKAVQKFNVEFTDLQREILRLLAVPEQAFMS